MRPTAVTKVLLLFLGLVVVAGCGSAAPDGPPAIRVGDSVCDECGMIISDERFATATIGVGVRGPEPKLFDDFNCQARYEAEHSEMEIVARWSHDYIGAQWLRTEQAHFVTSVGLRTPMASRTVAFAKPEDARALQQSIGGELLNFDSAWVRLGSDGACCAGGHENEAGAEQPSAANPAAGL
ncbi:MAG: nitrous oxide reductase accessory protein NosL [Planctomycetota bacterium]